jgi:hypothetical protein
MGAVDNAVTLCLFANEVSPYLGLCPLVCRLVANGATSSRASADTDEVVIKNNVVADHLVVVCRVVAHRREVQSEFWSQQPDLLRQRFH